MTELTQKFIKENVKDTSYLKRVGQIDAFESYLVNELGIETEETYKIRTKDLHKFYRIGKIYYDLVD